MLEKGIDQGNNGYVGHHHGPERRTFSDTTTDDGGDCCSKGQQEEELGQLITTVRDQRIGTAKEVAAVRNAVTHCEVGHCRGTKIGQDFYQRIDLVLMTNGAHF